MLQKTSYFFSDLIKTFIYFASLPLQWLFFSTPKLYEIVISVLVFIKNNVPSKQELYYTWFHWMYGIFKLLCVLLLCIINLLISCCKYLQKILFNITQKLEKYS